MVDLYVYHEVEDVEKNIPSSWGIKIDAYLRGAVGVVVRLCFVIATFLQF